MREYEKLQRTHSHVHGTERNMCMVDEVLRAECYAPIRSPPPTRPAAIALVTADPFSC